MLISQDELKEHFSLMVRSVLAALIAAAPVIVALKAYYKLEIVQLDKYVSIEEVYEKYLPREEHEKQIRTQAAQAGTAQQCASELEKWKRVTKNG